MAKYRVRRQSFIRGRVYEVGEFVDYDGYPGDNLEPTDATGEQAVKEAQEHFAAQRAAMQLQAYPEAAAMGVAVVNEVEKRSGRQPEGSPGMGLNPAVMPGADLSEDASARGRRSKS